MIEAAAVRLREAGTEAPAFAGPAAAGTFRVAVDRTLDGPIRIRLAQGDVAAAAGLAADPLDRLHLTRAYLEAAGVAEDPTARARLKAAIEDAGLDRHRARPGHAQAGRRHG